LVNIGLFLNPIEFADFFTGIFFYDLCDDDLGRAEDCKNVESVKDAEQVSVDNETENLDETAPEEDDTETSEQASDSDDLAVEDDAETSDDASESDDLATEDNTETTSDDASDSGDTPSDEDFDF
jgi:hypothetical protein